MPPQRKFPVRPAIFLAIVVLCTIVAYLPPVRSRISLEEINAQLAALSEIANRSYGPPVFILGAIVLILVQLPGLIPVVVAGLVYGLGEAFLYSIIACSLGVTATFLIARFFLRDYFRPKLAKSFLGHAVERLEGSGILGMCLLRLVLVMTPPMNWMLGATNIKVRDYLIGTIIGLSPVILAVLLVVQKLKSVQSIRDIWQPEVIAAIAVLAALTAAILLVRRKLRANAKTE